MFECFSAAICDERGRNCTRLAELVSCGRHFVGQSSGTSCFFRVAVLFGTSTAEKFGVRHVRSLPQMACLNTLKQEIKTLESVFPKSHERFQIMSASVDELSCRFVGKNGKKYEIHANITVSVPSMDAIWDSKSIRNNRQYFHFYMDSVLSFVAVYDRSDKETITVVLLFEAFDKSHAREHVYRVYHVRIVLSIVSYCSVRFVVVTIDPFSPQSASFRGDFQTN